MENILDDQRSLFQSQYGYDIINAECSGDTPYREAEFRRHTLRNFNPILSQNERVESRIKREVDCPVSSAILEVRKKEKKS